MAELEDFWDDFDDADVEECFLQASQVAPLPNITAPHATKSVVATNDAEKNEIKRLLDDPSNYDHFFDPMDGIDPDLLASQPIPGTQPRQRVQQVASSSIVNSKSALVSNSTIKSSTSSSGYASASKGVGGSANHMQTSSSLSKSNINHKISMRQGSTSVSPLKFNNSSSNTMKPPQAPLSASISQSKHPQVHHASSNTFAIPGSRHNQSYQKSFNQFQNRSIISSQASKPVVCSSFKQPIGHSTFINDCSKNEMGHSFVSSSQNLDIHDFSNIHPDTDGADSKTKPVEDDLRMKLMQSQLGMNDMEKEIMTKKGEVSNLRSELQRKAVALDTERLAKLAAQDMHRKEMQEKVASATREAQSKSRALEIRLEKLHADMAFKNREITELVTKCKKLEQQQVYQQKKHQHQMDHQQQLLSQTVCSQEHQADHTKAKVSPHRAAVPTVSDAGNATRHFPADRFDFSDQEPTATQTRAAKCYPIENRQKPNEQNQSSDLQKEQPTATTTLPVHDTKSHDDQAMLGKDEQAGFPLHMKKGFYNAALECVALLSDLSSGVQQGSSHDSSSQHTVQQCVNRVNTNPVHHYIDRKTKHAAQTLFDVDIKQPLRYESSLFVNKPAAQDETDSLCDRDADVSYTDDYFNNNNGITKDEKERVVIKKERVIIKKERVIFKRERSEEEMDVNNGDILIDRITESKISFTGILDDAMSRKKQLESWHKEMGTDFRGFCERREQLAENYAWSDARAQEVGSGDTVARTSGKRLRADGRHKDRNNTPAAECSSACVRGVAYVPQQWIRLLAVMGQDNTTYRLENMDDADMFDEQQRDDNTRQWDDSDGFELPEGKSLLERRQSVVTERIGTFLYNITQEMLDDNIRDLQSNNEDVKGEHLPSKTSTESTRPGISRSKEDDPSDIFLHCVDSNKHRGDENRCNATRDLFYSVLEWLSEEASYHRNLAKGLSSRREDDEYERQWRVMKIALVIMEHLLPLRFSSRHLPSPIVVLCYLLRPVDLCHKRAAESTAFILPCIRAASSHPDTVMTPELSVLLTERFCTICRHTVQPRQLGQLLMCLTSLNEHRTFVQTVCSVADDCLVWRVCVAYLRVCCEPGTASTAEMARPRGAVEDGGSSCLRALLRWVVSVLMSRPAWLFGDCQCHVVFLATLLIVTHSEVYQLVKALPLIHKAQQMFCRSHLTRQVEESATPATSDAVKQSGHKNKKLSTSSTLLVNSTKTSTINRTFANQTTLANSTRSATINTTALLSLANRNCTTMGNTFANETTMCQAGDTAHSNKHVSNLTCSLCNRATHCYSYCSCSGLCSDTFNENILDIHSACGCRCKLVWSAIRVLKFYVNTDSRTNFNMASVPYSTLLCKLLTDVLPFFAPLEDTDTGKLLSRLN